MTLAKFRNSAIAGLAAIAFVAAGSLATPDEANANGKVAAALIGGALLGGLIASQTPVYAAPVYPAPALAPPTGRPGVPRRAGSERLYSGQFRPDRSQCSTTSTTPGSSTMPAT